MNITVLQCLAVGLHGLLELEVYVHATEDESKVMKAIGNILPKDLYEKISFDKVKARGHYGNPIIIIKAEVKVEDLESLSKHILDKMESYDREYVRKSLEIFVDSVGTIHFRFDKQEAYLGRIVLKSSDPICLRLRFEIPPGRGLDPVRYVRGILFEEVRRSSC
ncbi:MAG: RNA-binding domain-containing protein [Candidatus Bathyarchaeia archaeon]